MKHIFYQQINLFFIALGFFSRIPIPKSVPFKAEYLNQASRYFTLVGWCLGLLVTGLYLLLDIFFPQSVTIFLCISVGLLLTGAFHEDGLADTFDGFYGGHTKADKLRIMKDSRLGTYGAAALFMSLLGKWILLTEITNVPMALLIAYPASRAIASSFIFDMDYARLDETSKSAPLASRQTGRDLLVSLACLLPLFLFVPTLLILKLFAVLILVRFALQWFMKRHLSGYTGDTLGACQQLSELTIYALLLGMSAS
jgi:adenosylcobinamide-GDP ribazoletransferase